MPSTKMELAILPIKAEKGVEKVEALKVFGSHLELY